MRNTHLFILCLAMGGGAIAAPPAYHRIPLPVELTRFSNLSKLSHTQDLSGPSERFTLRFERPKVLQDGKTSRFELEAVEHYSLNGLELPEARRTLAERPGYFPVLRIGETVVERQPEAVAPRSLTRSRVWGHEDSPEIPLEILPGRVARVARHPQSRLWEVTFFPVQVMAKTGDAILLREADVTVEWVKEPVGRDRGHALRGHSEAVIITREDLKRAARLLQDFHSRKLGVSTEIITVEEIARTESPIDEATLPDGVKDKNFGFIRPWDPVNKTGYNYYLARQIQSFLRNRMTSTSRTRYVVLLGSVYTVPPSYYFREPTPSGNRLAPTDQCYAGLAQCMDAKLAVGRLPFETTDEMARYLAKVEAWSETEFDSDLGLYGGRGFDDMPMFWGELSVMGMLPRLGASWPRISKNTRSKGSYTSRSVRELLYGQSPARLVFHADHGTGNEMRVDESTIPAQEIMDLLPEGSQLPILASIACNNAVYDESLVNESVMGPLSRGRYGFGVASLKSKAGAVAYIGPNRVSVGDPVYSKDRFGNVRVTGGTYFLGLLSGLLDPLEYGTRIGDKLLRAQRRYFAEMARSTENALDRWTYLTLTLLGDPLLYVPAAKEFQERYPEASSTTLLGAPDSAEPPKEVAYSSEVMTHASLFRVFSGNDEKGASEKLIARQVTVGSTAMPLRIHGVRVPDGLYLLTLENAVGAPVEGQVWFELKGASLIPYRP